MEVKKTENNDQIGRFLVNLTLIFIFLKLFPGSPVNQWSWLWVLSPTLIPISFLIITIPIAFVYFLIMNPVNANRKANANDYRIIKLTAAAVMIVTIMTIYF